MTEPTHPATIYNSEVFSLSSIQTQEDYPISVSLPRSYLADPDARYPTLYVIDGNLHFESVTGLARMMGLNGTIPELIIVGIGYDLEGFHGDQYKQFFARSATDLSAL